MADCSCNNFPSNLGNVTFGANVGIGTTNPLQRLQIGDGSGGGNAALVINAQNGSGYISELRFFDPSLAAGSGYNFFRSTYGGNTDVGSYWGMNFIVNTPGRGGDPVGQHSFAFKNNATTLVTIRDDGRVGIGRTDPQARLHVLDTFMVGDLAAGSRQALEFAAGTADLYVGSQTQDGNISVRNLAGTAQIQLNGNDGSVVLNGTLYAGSRAVANSSGCLYA